MSQRVACLLFGLTASVASAQAPRFLSAPADSAAPAAVVDPMTVPALQAKIPGRFEAGPATDAVRRISEAARVSIIFQSQLIAGAQSQAIGADSVTLVRALEAALFGALVDVVIRSPTSFVIVPRVQRVAGLAVASGTVHDSLTGRPVAGVVVIALDGTRRAIARTLTGENGGFQIETPARISALRVQRIGYRMRELSEISFDGVDIAVASLPSLLEPVVARMAAGCPVRSDNAAAMALLDQARSGLLATIVTRQWPGARFKVLGYERRYVRGSARILWQTVRSDSQGDRATAFRAGRDPDQFVTSGFMESSSKGKAFFGPDAEVLLDSRFSDAYCFAIASAKERPGQVGLRFGPARTTSGRIDIDGVLWIDTVSRTLRDIEYDYVGMGQYPASVRPRGVTSFQSLPNGVVVIDQWWIRLPGVQEDTIFVASRPALEKRFFSTESGGQLAHAEWPDGTKYQATLGALHVTALARRDSSPLTSPPKPTPADFVPAAGITFRLANTDYEATTDAKGNAEITDLLPGPYAMHARDRALALLDVDGPAVLELNVEGAAVLQREIKVPTARDFGLAGCRRQGVDAPPRPEVYLLGKVVDAAGVPMRDVYLEYRMAFEKKPFLKRTTGPTGQFFLCLPDQRDGYEVTISARAPDGRSRERTVRFGHGVTPVEIVLTDRVTGR